MDYINYGLWLSLFCTRNWGVLINIFSSVQPLLDHPAAGTSKRLSVERIYQRKTQLEHILLRPDTYVGSVEETTETMWIYDSEKEAIVKKQITFVPGLYKIFDEILGTLTYDSYCSYTSMLSHAQLAMVFHTFAGYSML